MTPPLEPTTGVHERPRASHPPIEVLVALHDRDVRSALRRVLGRSQDEDDLVQEVFTRLVVRLRQPGELCVAAWLRGVAHNLAVDEIRRRRPVPVEEVRLDRAVASSADDAVAGADLYGRVVDGAYSLPRRQRAALAAALGGGGVATVASRLGVSVHAAESLLTRARVGLRNHLAAIDPDAGSTRSSLAGVVVAVGSALGIVLRRWRAAATLTVAGGAVVAASFAPAVLHHDAVAGPERPWRPEPVAAAPGGGDEAGGSVTAGEVRADAPGGDVGASPADAPEPAAAGAAPSSPAAPDAGVLAGLTDSLDVGLPGTDLRPDLAGTCVDAAEVLDALLPAEQLLEGLDGGALCPRP